MTGQDQKLKCLLFSHSERLLPPAQFRDVIKFHRLNIRTCNFISFHYRLLYDVKYSGPVYDRTGPGVVVSLVHPLGETVAARSVW